MKVHAVLINMGPTFFVGSESESIKFFILLRFTCVPHLTVTFTAVQTGGGTFPVVFLVMLCHGEILGYSVA